MILNLAVSFLLLVQVAADSHNDEWHFNVEYDVPFNLSCVPSHMEQAPDMSRKTLRWILPNGNLVEPYRENHERVELHMDGQILKIKEVKDEDFGQYFCLIYDSSEGKYTVVKKGINIDGPYWGDLQAKYQQGIIVGSVAAAIVFVLMIGICYLFERNPVLIGRDSHLMGDFVKSDPTKNGYDNAAIEMEPTITEHSTKEHEVHVADAEYTDVSHVHISADDSPNTHL